MIRHLLLLCLPLSALAKPTDQMNILLITIEDWSSFAVGCYGNEVVQTPFVDALAKRSLQFNRAYCQAPICNPSRASFVTGLYPDATNIYGNADVMDQLVPASAPSMAALMAKQEGADLSCYGKLVHKWNEAHRFAEGFHHLEYTHHYDIPEFSTGEAVRCPAPPGIPDEVEHEAFFLPNREVAGELRRLYQEREYKLANGAEDNWELRKPFQQLYAEQLGDSGLREDEMEDGRFARSAAKRLETLAQKRQQFFMHVGFYATHTPLLAPKEYVDLYDPAKMELTPAPREKDQGVPNQAVRNGSNYDLFNGFHKGFEATPLREREALAAYYACSSYIDAQVGILTEALSKSGLLANTIVILFSDHGFHLGEHGCWSKYTLFEQATRVPFLISIPGKTDSGATTESLVELVDVLPTLCDLWQIEKPVEIQGKTLLPLFTDPTLPHKEACFSVLPLLGTARSVRSEQFKYAEYRTRQSDMSDLTTTASARELYNLVADPYEQNNLANDPASSRILDQHKELLRSHAKRAKGDFSSQEPAQ